jgi:hypothetical protein
MSTEQITIEVAPEVARMYRAASDEGRRKLALLANLRLQDIARHEESLEEVIARISGAAQARGLTPDLLDSLLRDDS